jgi:hypothetical protein
MGVKPPCPRFGRSRGPFAPLRSLTENFPSHHLRRDEICLRRRPVGCATNIAALTAGLKPATTKQRSRRRLQRTRRSCYAPKLFCQRTADSLRRRESVVGRNRLKAFYLQSASAASRLLRTTFAELACQPQLVSFPASEGWWRIPGSNR